MKSAVGGSLPNKLKILCWEDNLVQAEITFRAYFQHVMFEDLYILNVAEWIIKSLKSRGYHFNIFINKCTSDSCAIVIKSRTYRLF